MSLVEGSVTRLAGCREYVRVGLTAAFPAADTCQSSNRTFLKIGKLFTAKSLTMKHMKIMMDFKKIPKHFHQPLW
ncbi:MAG: hypothetical protein CVV06_08745 [Gammaproteobacteria bacterium HGW-Gammaproteobacteria-10]|nr:MAG: hypothetical protein CVV06_08745 [Gammaproteobacteria bacterium HGW-Gammaproteobacteria-10]